MKIFGVIRANDDGIFGRVAVEPAKLVCTTFNASSTDGILVFYLRNSIPAYLIGTRKFTN